MSTSMNHVLRLEELSAKVASGHGLTDKELEDVVEATQFVCVDTVAKLFVTLVGEIQRWRALGGDLVQGAMLAALGKDAKKP